MAAGGVVDMEVVEGRLEGGEAVAAAGGDDAALVTTSIMAMVAAESTSTQLDEEVDCK